MSRTVQMHVFCSIKGGVGKSTLAVACAKLLAAGGRLPTLIDVHLAGTSFVDGLLLRAPKVALCSDGSLEVDALHARPDETCTAGTAQAGLRPEGLSARPL